MKFLFIFCIAYSFFILENRAQKTMECKTGNVTIAKKDELGKVFLSEYGSKSNFAWNTFTGNWFSHLTKLGEYTRFHFCDCIFSKSNPIIGNYSFVHSADLTTIREAELDFSFINIKSSTPLVNCVLDKDEFYIMEGYRSNGLQRSMDIYVLKTAGAKVPGGKYPIKFAALIQSVQIPECHVCFGI